MLPWREIGESQFLTAASHQVWRHLLRGFWVIQIDSPFVNAVEKDGRDAVVLSAEGKPLHRFPREGELRTGVLRDHGMMRESITVVLINNSVPIRRQGVARFDAQTSRR